MNICTTTSPTSASPKTLAITLNNVSRNYKMITTEELINILENDSMEHGLKSIAENLLEAISDRPKSVREPSELISELKKHITDKLTFDNIDKFLKTLRVEKDAWKIASLSGLLEMFNVERNLNVDREVELEVILERIT